VFEKAYELLWQQREYDQQAANRTFASEGVRQPARFQRYENEAADILREVLNSEAVFPLIDWMKERIEQDVAREAESDVLRQRVEQLEAAKT
jgi:CBS-domain-containing membrane protein